MRDPGRRRRHRAAACRPRPCLSCRVKRIAYTVRAVCPDVETADRFVRWLEDGHVDQVISGGAHSAMIVRFDAADSSDGPRTVEVRYIFSTRAVFDRYIAEHAPALRADGLKHFGHESGVVFERSLGEVV